MKPTDFSVHVTSFLTHYLAAQRKLGVHPRSASGLPSGVLFVSSREATERFFPPVVSFHGCDNAIRFLKRPSLTVIHLMSGNAWSYLRLVAYGFLGLSEGA
jgi:hypothetical protein